MLFIVDWLNHYVSATVEICGEAAEAQLATISPEVQQAALLAYLSQELFPSYPKLHLIQAKLQFFLEPGLFPNATSHKVSTPSNKQTNRVCLTEIGL